MKLTKDEKQFIERVAAVANKDKNLTRDIWRAFSIALTKELFGGNNKLILPFVGEVEFEVVNKPAKGGVESRVVSKFTPSEFFTETVADIASGKTTPTERYLEEELERALATLLKAD